MMNRCFLEGEHDLLDVQGAWVYLLLNWVWSKAGLHFYLNWSRQDAFSWLCLIK